MAAEHLAPVTDLTAWLNDRIVIQLCQAHDRKHGGHLDAREAVVFVSITGTPKLVATQERYREMQPPFLQWMGVQGYTVRPDTIRPTTLDDHRKDQS